MICPRCSAGTKVLYTRGKTLGDLRRRRQCENGHRFTTCEILWEDQNFLTKISKLIFAYALRKGKK